MRAGGDFKAAFLSASYDSAVLFVMEECAALAPHTPELAGFKVMTYLVALAGLVAERMVGALEEIVRLIAGINDWTLMLVRAELGKVSNLVRLPPVVLIVIVEAVLVVVWLGARALLSFESIHEEVLL